MTLASLSMDEQISRISGRSASGIFAGYAQLLGLKYENAVLHALEFADALLHFCRAVCTADILQRVNALDAVRACRMFVVVVLVLLILIVVVMVSAAAVAVIVMMMVVVLGAPRPHHGGDGCPQPQSQSSS